jgi:type I site-specific restriction endonuclease
MAQDGAQGAGEQGPWLTLSEAAECSGLHREALRARAKRKQLPSQRNNLGQLLVMLPPDLLTLAQGGAQGAAQAQAEQLADLVRDLEQELAEVRATARADLAEAIAERNAAREVAEAKVMAMERQLADLREQLAWHRRSWWRRLRG